MIGNRCFVAAPTLVIGLLAGGFRWYPTGEGFYTRGGFGAGTVTATLKDPEDDAETEYDDYGLGLLAGVGYDVSITERFSTGPRVDVVLPAVDDGLLAVGDVRGNVGWWSSINTMKASVARALLHWRVWATLLDQCLAFLIVAVDHNNAGIVG